MYNIEDITHYHTKQNTLYRILKPQIVCYNDIYEENTIKRQGYQIC
jgi:hypothetical protein